MFCVLTGPTGRELRLHISKETTIRDLQQKIKNVFSSKQRVQVLSKNNVLSEDCLLEHIVMRNESLSFRFIEDISKTSREPQFDSYFSRLSKFIKSDNETCPRIEAVYNQGFSVSKIQKMNLTIEQRNSIEALNELGFSQSNSIAALNEFHYDKFIAANYLSRNKGMFPIKHELVIEAPLYRNNEKLSFREEEMIAKYRSLCGEIKSTSPYASLNPDREDLIQKNKVVSYSTNIKQSQNVKAFKPATVPKRFHNDTTIVQKLQKIDLRCINKSTIEDASYKVGANFNSNFEYPKMLMSIIKIISLSDQLANVDWYNYKIPIPTSFDSKYMTDYINAQKSLEKFVYKYGNESYEMEIMLCIIQCSILQRLKTAFSLYNIVEAQRLINIIRNITTCNWK